jgi:hypothetical protein
MREKARRRKEEALALLADTLRKLEEREGVPVMQFDAYADAVERYGLEGGPGIGDGATVGETIAQARTRYQQMIDAMSAYTLKGGRSRWGAYGQAVSGYGAGAYLAVINAQAALHASGAGFSERTDPAFSGRVEPDADSRSSAASRKQ